MGSPAPAYPKTWEWINMLSLDVCAGALAGGIMATRLLDVSPGWAYWLVLTLAVWLIYTADHIIDGYRAGEKARHKRHIFHFKYIRSFIIVALVAAGFRGPAVAVIHRSRR